MKLGFFTVALGLCYGAEVAAMKCGPEIALPAEDIGVLVDTRLEGMRSVALTSGVDADSVLAELQAKRAIWVASGTVAQYLKLQLAQQGVPSVELTFNSGAGAEDLDTKLANAVRGLQIGPVACPNRLNPAEFLGALAGRKVLLEVWPMGNTGGQPLDRVPAELESLLTDGNVFILMRLKSSH